MIIFLYGSDTFRMRQKLREFKAKFQKEVDEKGDNIKTIDGEKMNLPDFASAFSAGSLFVKKQMVIVENIFSNKNKEIFEELSSFLIKKEEENKEGNKSLDENIVIFCDDDSGDKLVKNKLRVFLLKQKFVQTFAPLSLINLNQWIVARTKEYGGVITNNNVLKISGMYGNDMWKIDSEIKKLVNYKKGLGGQVLENGDVIIENSDLIILSPGKIDENIFALTDAIANKDKSKAMELLENEIESGKAPMYLLNMIMRQFKILLEIRQALDFGYGQAKITTDLKMHPYVVQKSLRQAKNFSFDFLKKVYIKLTEMDMNLKTGRADFMLSIDLMIVGL